MPVVVRARFDGRVFIPEEPVELREGEEGLVLFTPVLRDDSSTVDDPERVSIVLQRLMSTGVEGTNIPAELLRREHLYED